MIRAFWGSQGPFQLWHCGYMRKQQEWGRMRQRICMCAASSIVKSCISRLQRIFSFESDCCLSAWGPGGIPHNVAGVEEAGSLGNHRTTLFLCLWVLLDIFPHYFSSDPGELTWHLSVPNSWLEESVYIFVPKRARCVANEGYPLPFTLAQCLGPPLLDSKVEWSRVGVPATVSAL